MCGPAGLPTRKVTTLIHKRSLEIRTPHHKRLPLVIRRTQCLGTQKNRKIVIYGINPPERKNGRVFVRDRELKRFEAFFQCIDFDMIAHDTIHSSVAD